MKIRSLLLGSLAAAGLSTAGFAADLGVVTSLDICDELGISGLTISSDDNCLAITGGVSFEYSLGDFHDGDGTDFDGVPAAPADDGFEVWHAFARNNGFVYADAADGVLDSTLDIDAWLKFVGSANSDFGKATMTIKLLSENISATADPAVVMDEAWVGIGDTTIIMAGHKGSIFNDGDDAPLNYLGLYNSSDVDAGVGFSGAIDANMDGDVLDAGDQGGAGAKTGGNVIQLTHSLGNGLSIGGAIENLMTSGLPAANPTFVGVIAYAGDGVSAHAGAAADLAGAWKAHAGFTGTWDPIKVVGAVAANNDVLTGALWWNALGSVEATFDMFKLAVSGEATSAGEWGVGGSVGATVTDGVSINLGGRYFGGVGENIGQVELGLSAAVTETITLTAAVGAESGSAHGGYYYGKGGIAWAPGGGFTASLDGKVTSLGGYKATFKAAKEIK